MEGEKPTAGSSSSSSSSSASFTTNSEKLGSKDSFFPSAGIFNAIFAPPLNSPKVLSREALRSELTRKMYTDAPMHYKCGEPGYTYYGREVESQSTTNKDAGYYYQDHRDQQPCQFSSSIYYGGQDIYHHPQNSQKSSVYNKDGTYDDGTACRGNWWQGSLYY